MSEQIVPLDELMKELPPEHQRELRDFAEFLLARHGGGVGANRDSSGPGP
jgi:hypothetical protein